VTFSKCHCKIKNTNTSSVPFDLGLSIVDKMSLQDKENTSSVPFDLGLSHVDKMSLQDKEHQYKLCSF
jgi:hypothetical protein